MIAVAILLLLLLLFLAIVRQFSIFSLCLFFLCLGSILLHFLAVASKPLAISL